MLSCTGSKHDSGRPRQTHSIVAAWCLIFSDPFSFTAVFFVNFGCCCLCTYLVRFPVCLGQKPFEDNYVFFLFQFPNLICNFLQFRQLLWNLVYVCHVCRIVPALDYFRLIFCSFSSIFCSFHFIKLCITGFEVLAHLPSLSLPNTLSSKCVVTLFQLDFRTCPKLFRFPATSRRCSEVKDA